MHRVRALRKFVKEVPHILVHQRTIVEQTGEFPVLMYAEVDNHFGCGIDGEVYDITGNVTNQYKWCKWAKFRAREPKVAEQIEYNCMNF